MHWERRGHVVGDLAQHAFLRRGGFERQHALDLLAHLGRQRESDAVLLAGARALDGQPALQPEEFVEDQTPLPRRAELVEHVYLVALFGKVCAADGVPTLGQLQAIANGRRQRIFERRKRLKHTVDQRAEHARRNAPGGFVDRHHTAQVQRGVARVVIRQQFELRMHHQQFRRVSIELDFAIERDAAAFLQDARQVRSVKPFTKKRLSGTVFKAGFEQTQVAALKTRRLGRSDRGDNGGHFAGSQLRDGLDVRAVLVAERRVGKQILDRHKAFGLENLSAGGAHAFHVHKGSRGVHREV